MITFTSFVLRQQSLAGCGCVVGLMQSKWCHSVLEVRVASAVHDWTRKKSLPCAIVEEGGSALVVADVVQYSSSPVKC